MSSSLVDMFHTATSTFQDTGLSNNTTSTFENASSPTSNEETSVLDMLKPKRKSGNFKDPSDRNYNVVKVSKKALKGFSLTDPSLLQVPTVTLTSTPACPFVFETKNLDLFEPAKIGRQTTVKCQANNGVFDSKVLSRQHAELMAGEKGEVLLRDTGSSNGTFVNGERLSVEGQMSEWRIIKSNDLVEFGIDVFNEDGELLYSRVSCTVKISRPIDDLDKELLMSPIQSSTANNSNRNSAIVEAATPTQPRNVEQQQIVQQEGYAEQMQEASASSHDINSEIEALRSRLQEVEKERDLRTIERDEALRQFTEVNLTVESLKQELNELREQLKNSGGEWKVVVRRRARTTGGTGSEQRHRSSVTGSAEAILLEDDGEIEETDSTRHSAEQLSLRKLSSNLIKEEEVGEALSATSSVRSTGSTGSTKAKKRRGKRAH